MTSQHRLSRLNCDRTGGLYARVAGIQHLDRAGGRAAEWRGPGRGGGSFAEPGHAQGSGAGRASAGGCAWSRAAGSLRL